MKTSIWAIIHNIILAYTEIKFVPTHGGYLFVDFRFVAVTKNSIDPTRCNLVHMNDEVNKNFVVARNLFFHMHSAVVFEDYHQITEM